MPSVPSLVGAAAALILIWSMFLFLDDLRGDNQRAGGLLVSILFLSAGAGLMLLARDRRAANAGVGLSAVAVVPLLIYAFVDVRSPENTFGSAGDITGTTTAILLLAAIIWLTAHFFGPSARHGLLLGAALVALWLVGVVQVIDGSIDQVNSPVEPTFVPIGEVADDPWAGDSWAEDSFTEDPWADDPWSDDQWADDPWADDDSWTGGSGEVITWDEPGPTTSDPSTRLGVVSLFFGGTYLVLAAVGDRRGRVRQATPLFAVALPILALAVLFLGDTLDVEGSSLLAVVLGSAAAWSGTRSNRRFTSWFGTTGAAFGLIALASTTASDSGRVQAIVLLLLGIALAVAAFALEGGGSEPRRPRSPSSGSPGAGPHQADHTPPQWSPPPEAAPGSGGQFGSPSGPSPWPSSPPTTAPPATGPPPHREPPVPGPDPTTLEWGPPPPTGPNPWPPDHPPPWGPDR